MVLCDERRRAREQLRRAAGVRQESSRGGTHAQHTLGRGDHSIPHTPRGRQEHGQTPKDYGWHPPALGVRLPGRLRRHLARHVLRRRDCRPARLEEAGRRVGVPRPLARLGAGARHVGARGRAPSRCCTHTITERSAGLCTDAVQPGRTPRTAAGPALPPGSSSCALLLFDRPRCVTPRDDSLCPPASDTSVARPGHVRDTSTGQHRRPLAHRRLPPAAGDVDDGHHGGDVGVCRRVPKHRRARPLCAGAAGGRPGALYNYSSGEGLQHTPRGGASTRSGSAAAWPVQDPSKTRPRRACLTRPQGDL